MLKEKMAEELNIQESFIDLVANRSSYYYKTFYINKKSSTDKREIHHPSPILKTFQYWLVQNIFIHLPISRNAMAYSKGASIRKNAEIHLGKKHILHTDIENFFPSINENHINQVLESNKEIIKREIGDYLSQKDIELVKKLTLFGERLTIGSVSSPIISNAIMYEVDKKIENIAESYNCIFTRYADDMIFSSNTYINSNIINNIESILLDNGFKLNNGKTYFMSSNNRLTVTGVIVNNNRLTIGRKKRDSIKYMVYMKCKYNIGDVEKILGYLSYLKDIDPYYYNRIILKYSRYGNVHELLMKPSIDDEFGSKGEAAATKE